MLLVFLIIVVGWVSTGCPRGSVVQTLFDGPVAAVAAVVAVVVSEVLLVLNLICEFFDSVPEVPDFGASLISSGFMVFQTKRNDLRR